MSYPKCADIADLVARLGKRKHPDCTAAAIKLEGMQAGLHNRTAELELAERRLAILGSLIERAAAQSREERNHANELVGVSLPSPKWFQFLSFLQPQFYRLPIHHQLKFIAHN